MSDIKEFISNGFVLKKKLFSNVEINKLNQYIAIRKDKEESARETNTSTGKLTMTMWNHPSEDLFGKFSTNERIVKPMETFLNDEVTRPDRAGITAHPNNFDARSVYASKQGSVVLVVVEEK